MKSCLLHLNDDWCEKFMGTYLKKEQSYEVHPNSHKNGNRNVYFGKYDLNNLVWIEIRDLYKNTDE